MDRIVFKSPSVDICSGDGSLMFQHLGGEFGFDYDLYLETRAKTFKHDDFIDIYDCDLNIHPSIRKRPEQIIDFATDWKPELLNKANRLGIYKKLYRHDNNQLPLPFDDEQLQTVFSTALYWTKNNEALLRDIYRMMRPGGCLATTVMTPLLLQTLDRLSPLLSPAAISILDRKRSATMQGSCALSDWENLLKKSGFKIEYIESIFPTENLIDIWNVGFRPISHLLIQMSEELSLQRRAEIKKEWVEIFFELMLPLLLLPNTCALEKAPYLMFIAHK